MYYNNNEIVYTNSREFYNFILKKSVLSDQFYSASMLDVQYSPYQDVNAEGVQEKIKPLPNSRYNGVNQWLKPCKIHNEYILKEQIVGIFAHQTIIDGYIYVLKSTDPLTYDYIRYSCPKTTAYLDYFPTKKEVRWLGYKTRSKKVKGAAMELLNWYVSSENLGEVNLKVVCDAEPYSKNKLCGLYEGLGFKFTGTGGRQEGYYANFTRGEI